MACHGPDLAEDVLNRLKHQLFSSKPGATQGDLRDALKGWNCETVKLRLDGIQMGL